MVNCRLIVKNGKNFQNLTFSMIYRPAFSNFSYKLDSYERLEVIRCIRELLKRDRLTLYALSYKTGMPLSTLKCILNGRSKNPGIVNIQKIAEGFNMSIREFYSCDLFDNLEQED